MANSNAPPEGGDDVEEVQSLLSASTTSTSPSSPKPEILSPSQTPRTANRVRFQLDEPPLNSDHEADGMNTPDWVEEEDYLAPSAANGGTRRDSDGGHRVPLLTDIEAPSVSLATADLEYDESDLLEAAARPKSGMRNAFMNMANSIM